MTAAPGAAGHGAVHTEVSEVIEVTIAPDHPAFDGHFPGAPVLPGVALLALVLDALRERPALCGEGTMEIEQVKWLAPVGPGQPLRITLAARGRGVDFGVARGSTAVARGRLVWRP